MTLSTPMPQTNGVPAPGFAEPVHQAQLTFRAVLDAMARPTRPVTVPGITGPDGLTPAGAALLLTLCDDATPLWLDDRLRSCADEVATWLAFHTGTPIMDRPGKASFAVVSSPAALPELGSFAEGTDEAPHTSATVIVLDPVGTTGPAFTADGPGFQRPLDWAAPALPSDFADQWAGNHARFPRGVDLIIAGTETVVGLPRTTRLTARPGIRSIEEN
ncbi:carbon-phosphorus lyase subunit PhnH [Microlunatus endophyticus]|uniref:Carbon-phosphorus lyase subunit PhnH n=1 Tax=Microlunatus endophyticus TaxID=1716077 RepID=A0A917W7P1_9ACTN|nr:phosphonate C-P lyase system protein PhnH [Microlunatus endophyticus]GGL73142.1 carbon-phosphorus lyase subunit PhnH [Microlunatus endophyticus]